MKRDRMLIFGVCLIVFPVLGLFFYDSNFCWILSVLFNVICGAKLIATANKLPIEETAKSISRRKTVEDNPFYKPTKTPLLVETTKPQKRNIDVQEEDQDVPEGYTLLADLPVGKKKGFFSAYPEVPDYSASIKTYIDSKDAHKAISNYVKNSMSEDDYFDGMTTADMKKAGGRFYQISINGRDGLRILDDGDALWVDCKKYFSLVGPIAERDAERIRRFLAKDEPYFVNWGVRGGKMKYTYEDIDGKARIGTSTAPFGLILRFYRDKTKQAAK